jgi:hypothetical protein
MGYLKLLRMTLGDMMQSDERYRGKWHYYMIDTSITRAMGIAIITTRINHFRRKLEEYGIMILHSAIYHCHGPLFMIPLCIFTIRLPENQDIEHKER